MTECTATAGRLGLGQVSLGLEGDALGSSAFLARDRDNQLFLGLWATTGSGRNGSPNVRSPRFRRQRPRLFGQQLLLTTSAGVKSLPNVKELTGGRTHALMHGFRANFLLGNSTETGRRPRRGISPLRLNQTLVVLAAEQVVSLSC